MKCLTAYLTCCLSLLVIPQSCIAQTDNPETSSPNAPVRFEATAESLSKHKAVPDWLRDAKLGIYFHWGPYTAAAYSNEWYPRWMHFGLKKSDWDGLTPGYHRDLMDWHTKKFGHPSEFGYHDMIPLFTGEKFNADQWADLFQKSGAKFAGPCAMHHDGYALWKSKVTPWNAFDTGPNRDITGELAVALRKRGMKLITTFHHARNLQRYKGKSIAQAREKYGHFDKYHVFWNSHYPWIEGLATASEDPKLRLLYGNLPEEEWVETFWLGCLKEVIDNYQPDVIWFDSWLDQIPEKARLQFAAYYFNAAKKWGKEVAITHKHEDTPTSFSMLDLEKGRRNKLTTNPWLTDDTVSTGSWSYTENLKLKSPKRLVHDFIDSVAKNGQLLLNVSPKSDGSIPQDQQELILALGAWLEVNGEAIYNTRPWKIFGEGPTKLNSDGDFAKAIQYKPQDIRFTSKGDAMYATALGTPDGKLVIESLGTNAGHRDSISKVTALNGDHVASWSRNENALIVILKDDIPEQLAWAFRIE